MTEKYLKTKNGEDSVVLSREYMAILMCKTYNVRQCDMIYWFGQRWYYRDVSVKEVKKCH